ALLRGDPADGDRVPRLGFRGVHAAWEGVELVAVEHEHGAGGGDGDLHGGAAGLVHGLDPSGGEGGGLLRGEDPDPAIGGSDRHPVPAEREGGLRWELDDAAAQHGGGVQDAVATGTDGEDDVARLHDVEVVTP